MNGGNGSGYCRFWDLGQGVLDCWIMLGWAFPAFAHLAFAIEIVKILN